MGVGKFEDGTKLLLEVKKLLTGEDLVKEKGPAEKGAAAAEELASQTTQLQGMLEGFKLKES